MDTSSSSINAGAQIRQKRVLPSRSRRGGPGVGSCDVDLMILDTQKRQSENEPLIPAETQFLLTTNTTLVPATSESPSIPGELGFNPHANERYFDRPEVLKAYKEQQTIQTPEFINLADDASVGGRFRPRGLEDEAADTSDAAYEKRHRKYETFEKRQRLREKEKLKHEHYKLKERIEQLRAMDGAAYLTLPPSSFSLPPGRLADDAETVTNLPGAHTNGAAAHSEGERRRKEMLDIASTLEERYRVLLPPDRIKKGGRPGSINASIEPEFEVTAGKESRRRYDDGESEVEEEALVEVAETEVEKIKLKIKFPARQNPSLPQSSASVSRSSSSKKHRTSLPPLTKNLPTRGTRATHILEPMVSTSLPRLDSHQAPTSSVMPIEPPSMSASLVLNLESLPNSPISNPDIAVLETGSPTATIVPDEEIIPEAAGPVIDITDSISDARPRKRMARDPSVPPIESISAPIHRSESGAATAHPPLAKQHVSYAGAAGQAERTTSVLMISALRSSSTPRARKTQRHLTAFGTKVPPDVEEMRDFELPAWLRNDPVFAKGPNDVRMDRVGGGGESLFKDVSVNSPHATVKLPKQGTRLHDFVGDVP